MKKGITAERKMMSRRVTRTKARARSRYYNLFAVIALLLVCIIMSAAVFPVFADAGQTREKFYTDYEIQPGDSLWSIAEDHICPEYSDSSKYMREVMELNHLTEGSVIHAGSYLVIPYYSDTIG